MYIEIYKTTRRFVRCAVCHKPLNPTQDRTAARDVLAGLPPEDARGAEAAETPAGGEAGRSAKAVRLVRRGDKLGSARQPEILLGGVPYTRDGQAKTAETAGGRFVRVKAASFVEAEMGIHRKERQGRKDFQEIIRKRGLSL